MALYFWHISHKKPTFWFQHRGHQCLNFTEKNSGQKRETDPLLSWAGQRITKNIETFNFFFSLSMWTLFHFFLYVTSVSKLYCLNTNHGSAEKGSICYTRKVCVIYHTKNPLFDSSIGDTNVSILLKKIVGGKEDPINY